MSYKIWCYLGWSDIKQRYRGSFLGPIWITISMTIFILMLSILYTKLFHQNIREFLPYLTAGMLSWTFISSTINDSSDTFVNAKELIERTRLPYIIYVLRMVLRNQIIFAHNFVVLLIVATVFDISWYRHIFLFLPGFLLVSLILVNLAVIIGLLGTRFRDIPPVISSMVTIIFFVSPITWQTKMIGDSWIVKLNPVAYMLDLMRTPLLGGTPALMSWFVNLGILALCFFVSFVLFTRCRQRIPFWV